MLWTSTHRFVVLAMHVAHQGDDELQDEEQAAMVAACGRVGMDADVADDQMVRTVDEACRAYIQARGAGMEQALVDEAAQALADAVPREVCLRLLRELRDIAKAHGGVHAAEHEALMGLRERWGITSLA